MKTAVTQTGVKKVKAKSTFTLMVEKRYEKQSNERIQGNTLSAFIGNCFAAMSYTQHTWKRETFRDLLLHLESQGCYAVLRDKDAIEVLVNIATFGNKMIRLVSSWEKKEWNKEANLSSLIQHCFAKYTVPSFIENAFYTDNKIHMFWYIQLGRGDSVVDLSGFPVTFTKRMAHEFINASADFTINQAIRWAQAKGFNANDLVAETIAWSSLSEGFEQEEFTTTIVTFFAKQNVLAFDKLQEILEYVTFCKAGDATFTMKGRTLEALTRQSDEWHIAMRKKAEAENRAQWKPCGLNGFVKKETINHNAVTFTILELLNSEELYKEGYEMSHCVADYENECMEGSSAIFSLRKYLNDAETILATIEYSPETNSIVQAKAAYNEYLQEETFLVLKEWCIKEKINIHLDEYDADLEEDYIALANNVALWRQPQEYNERPYERPRNHYPDENYSTDSWKYIVWFIFLLLKACVLFKR